MNSGIGNTEIKQDAVQNCAKVVLSETVIPRKAKIALNRMDFFVDLEGLHKQMISVFQHLPRRLRNNTPYLPRLKAAIFDLVELGLQYRYASREYRLVLIADMFKKESVFSYYLMLANKDKLISNGLFMELGKRLSSMEDNLIKMYNSNKQALLNNETEK